MSTPPPNGPLLTRESLTAQRAALAARPGGSLLAHPSPSALGRVDGGPGTVVRALPDAPGPDGTPVVPARTGDLRDPAPWRAPPVTGQGGDRPGRGRPRRRTRWPTPSGGRRCGGPARRGSGTRPSGAPVVSLDS
ncbi:AAC(3) family N-acetyltransferase [Streptomyces sp. NPDC014986]|uniref:AAC(3) family N-acetyltransferase n=1 Tax=Streptomyces sp. NPDC014986 TaxID=3364934 RepID=UPI003702F2D3